jgi:hypothetical protein
LCEKLQLLVSVFVEIPLCVDRMQLHDPCFVCKHSNIGQWLHHSSFYATDNSFVYWYVYFKNEMLTK